MTRLRRSPLAALVLAGLLLAGGRADAQDAAGTVASVQGRAESKHAGQAAWAALATGASVFVGDGVRTGEQSRLKLLMRDDSVITLGPRSELTIDAQVLRREGGTSELGALVGSVRAVVTDRYGTKGSSFQMKTPTAVAGVRGTGFVALVDPDRKRTRVIGLYDTTFVRGLVDPKGLHEVEVGPMQITEILAGGLPSKPKTLPRAEFDALVSTTETAGPTAGTPPPAEGAGEAPPEEGSGDRGDPATPGPPGAGSLQRPDGKIDQPIDQLRRPREPPPPPPRGNRP